MSDYEDYKLARAEARACGYEFPTYDEWSGRTSLRAQAEARIAERRREYDREEDIWDDYD